MRLPTFVRSAAFWIMSLSVALGVTLRATNLIGEEALLGVLLLGAISALAMHFSPRLIELNLREAKLVLQEVKNIKADLEAMYGPLEGIKLDPDTYDNKWPERMGVGNSLITAKTVVQYVSGCITRERERLARAVIVDPSAERLAQAIVDRSMDDLVFKWFPKSVGLDRPPLSSEERAKRKHGPEPDTSA